MLEEMTGAGGVYVPLGQKNQYRGREVRFPMSDVSTGKTGTKSKIVTYPFDRSALTGSLGGRGQTAAAC